MREWSKMSTPTATVYQTKGNENENKNIEHKILIVLFRIETDEDTEMI